VCCGSRSAVLEVTLPCTYTTLSPAVTNVGEGGGAVVGLWFLLLGVRSCCWVLSLPS
jgi:hypothetical protein